MLDQVDLSEVIGDAEWSFLGQKQAWLNHKNIYNVNVTFFGHHLLYVSNLQQMLFLHTFRLY